jgi:putative nucleotidyltransferase with HDIG domain
MITRAQALDLVRANVSKKNVIFHMIAVEAIMRELAKQLEEDEERWGRVGLLHDIDYEKTETTPEKHSLLAANILRNIVDEPMIRAIESHNFEHTGVRPENRMEKGLIATDAVSGLIIACALVMPSKKLADVKVESISKKFKDKDFARGAHRDKILFCEQIGLPKDKFFEVALNGLKGSASEIGL